MNRKILISIAAAIILVAAGAVWFILFHAEKKVREVSYNGVAFMRIERKYEDPLIISKYEITQRQYTKIMGNNPSTFKDNPDNPVESVTRDEIIDYCIKMSIACDLIPYYQHGTSADKLITCPSADGFRIPTADEWEYAVRGGTETTYYWGNEINGDYLWYKENSGGKTHPVGGKKPNSFGLYDMCGNVFELCFSKESGGLCGAIMGGDYSTINNLYFTHDFIFSPPAITMRNNGIGIRVVKNNPAVNVINTVNNKRVCYANSLNGLVLRRGPAVSSGKITLLPYGAFLVVVETGASETISGKSGEWLKVKWYPSGDDSSKYMEGWCFGGSVTDTYPGYMLPPGAIAGKSFPAGRYIYSIYSNLYDMPFDESENPQADMFADGQVSGSINFNDSDKTVILEKHYSLVDPGDDGSTIDNSYTEEKSGVYSIQNGKVYIKFKTVTFSSRKENNVAEKIDEKAEYMFAETDKYYLLLM